MKTLFSLPDRFFCVHLPDENTFFSTQSDFLRSSARLNHFFLYPIGFSAFISLIKSLFSLPNRIFCVHLPDENTLFPTRPVFLLSLNPIHRFFQFHHSNRNIFSHVQSNIYFFLSTFY